MVSVVADICSEQGLQGLEDIVRNNFKKTGVMIIDTSCVMANILNELPTSRADDIENSLPLCDLLTNNKNNTDYMLVLPDIVIGELRYLTSEFSGILPDEKELVSEWLETRFGPIFKDHASFVNYLDKNFPLRETKIKKRERSSRTRRLSRLKSRRTNNKRVIQPIVYLTTGFSKIYDNILGVDKRKLFSKVGKYCGKSPALKIVYQSFENEIGDMGIFHTSVEINEGTGLDTAVVSCDKHFNMIRLMCTNVRSYTEEKRLQLIEKICGELPEEVPDRYETKDGRSISFFSPKSAYNFLTR